LGCRSIDAVSLEVAHYRVLVDDLLEGLGKLLGTLQLGSIAEWVGAIATVGALFWAFLVFTADRRRAKRAEADRFASYITSTTAIMNGLKTESATAKFEFFNAGDTPVPMAQLVVCHPGGDIRIPLRIDGGYVIRPGAQISFRLKFEDCDVFDVFSYLAFDDSHGREWLRDVVTGRYVPLRRRGNGKWLRYKGGLRVRWHQFRENRRVRPREQYVRM
jgi:hypothetical protein